MICFDEKCDGEAIYYVTHPIRENPSHGMKSRIIQRKYYRCKKCGKMHFIDDPPPRRIGLKIDFPEIRE